MVEFRKIVRGFGQQGVPDSVRAVPVPQPRLDNDISSRQGLMVEYIKAHQGERINLAILSKAAGYRGHTGGALALKKLVRSGLVIRRKLRKGKGSGYTYVYTGKTAGYNPTNGPVEVSQASTAQIRYVTPERPVSPTQKPRDRVAEVERAWLVQLDTQIIGFLRDLSGNSSMNTSDLGKYTKSLLDFSGHLKGKTDDVEQN